MLRIRLLGGLDVREGEEIVSLAESARARSLLAYLLLHRDAPTPRQRVAFLFWPDSSEEQARTNLRHLLHSLRHALPQADRFLEITPQTLRWRADAPFWLDVAAFEQALAREPEAAALRQAVELYAGDLLEGRYDDWLLAPRERLRQRYLGALEQLTALLAERGDLVEAIAHAQRLVREEPLQEGPYRQLMRVHAAAGDRARAVRVYHACVSTLERELGVAPSATTVTAYEQLMAAPVGAPPAPERAERISGPALVGRAAESALLQKLGREAQEGRAQLVLVSGEPGVGKTRLVEELAAWCVHQDVLVVRARAYAAEGALAYGMMIEWLRSPGLAPALERLARPDRAELARLLPELAADAADETRLLASSVSEQRRRFFEAATRALLATRQPLLLVADDLHWADVETMQFLHYVLRVEPLMRLLVVATARRELLDDHASVGQLRTGLQTLERYAEIQLERLGRDETAALAEQLGGRALGPGAADRLHVDTEGNALFVVETVRAGWHGEAAPALAPKLQAVIRARLAQLSAPARELVGVAATIGRDFGSDVLGGASDTDGETFVAALDELWRRGIVREQGADAYDFSHDKLREVAYDDLGAARRRHHHLKVAEALLRLHGPEAIGVRGQLAAHFEHAGRLDDAVTWAVRAAEAAQAVHAYGEAVRLLDRALGALARLPQDKGRIERALEISAAIPVLIGVVEGFTSPRLTAAQERALGQARASSAEPAPVLVRSLALSSLSRRDHASARQAAAALVARGEHDGDHALVVEGHYILGVTAFWLGELHGARHHLEAALERYRAEERLSYLARFGHDPRVLCQGRQALTLLFLGFPDQARQACDETLALARSLDHPFTVGVALHFAALLSLELGDLGGARVLLAELEALPAEHQPVPNLLARSAYAGFVQVLDGCVDEGLARIESALREVPDVDPAPGMQAVLLRLLVGACAIAADPEVGLEAADRALGSIGSVRLWEADLRRTRAVFLRALGRDASEVEAELGRALAVARAQDAAFFVARILAEGGDTLGVSARA